MKILKRFSNIALTRFFLYNYKHNFRGKLVVKTKDEAWAEYQKRIEIAIAKKDYRRLQTIFYSMAHFVENEGRDSSYLRQKGYEANRKWRSDELKNDLRTYTGQNAELFANPEACESCQSRSGRVVPYSDLLAYLPVHECSGKNGCRCTYLPVIN